MIGAVLTPAQQALKNASLDLVKAAGGFDAAAGFCRIGKSQLSDACSVNHPDKWLPVDVVADLQGVTRGQPGWPFVTRQLAEREALVLVALPAVSSGPDFPAYLAQLAKEGGELMANLATALADGKVCSGDVARLDLLREAADVVRVAVAIQAAVRGVAA
jgi:hypothetical protein